MTRTRGLFLAAVAAILVSAAGTHAQAAFADFSYTTQASINGGPLGATGASMSATVGTPAPATVTLTLLPQTEGPLNASGVGSSIRFGNISVSSTSPTDQNIGSVPYAFVLTITDNTSGSTGQVTINGTLTGSARTTASNIANMYTPPEERSIVIGGVTYTVDTGVPGSYTAPSPGTAGSFGAQVVASGGGGTPTTTPEPASVVLFGMGLVGFVGFYRRRMGSRA